jgi:hypothetical protein
MRLRVSALALAEGCCWFGSEYMSPPLPCLRCERANSSSRSAAGASVDMGDHLRESFLGTEKACFFAENRL